MARCWCCHKDETDSKQLRCVYNASCLQYRRDIAGDLYTSCETKRTPCEWSLKTWWMNEWILLNDMNEIEHSVRLSPTWLGQVVQLVLPRVIIQICRKLESQKTKANNLWMRGSFILKIDAVSGLNLWVLCSERFFGKYCGFPFSPETGFELI